MSLRAAKKFGLVYYLPALAAGAGLGYVISDLPNAPKSMQDVMQLLPASLNPSCQIKGNISISTGEKIYHVPGQEHYDETVIRPSYGERWFCTEEQARSAGWRKSNV